MSEPEMRRCSTCGDPLDASDGERCPECDVAAQMTPEVHELPPGSFCGGCGSEDLDGAKIKPPFDEGGSYWIRCAACCEEWARGKREEERQAKAQEAALLSRSGWRWISARFDSVCVFCSGEITTGDKVKFAPSLRCVSHPGCTRPRLHAVDNGRAA